MKYHQIESLGIKVSAIGAGTWGIGGAGWGNINDDESIAALRYMIDNGVNLIDTAPVYGLGHSEEVVGRALKGLRDRVILVSKCGITRKKATGFGANGPVRDSSRGMILKQVDESLNRLNTDFLDVLLIHWPDVNTPFEETIEALNELKKQGKIRFCGICNFEADQIERFYELKGLDFAQYQFSMIENRWEKVMKKYHDLGVATMAYGALGGGILTGAYRKMPEFESDDMRTNFYPFFKEPVFSKCQDLLKAMDEIADHHNVPVSQVGLNWCANHPSVSVTLTGVSKVRHAKDNCDALNWDLLDDERKILEDKAQEVIDTIHEA